MMLPPINLLQTDLVEAGSENPAGTGFYRDSTGFQVSLGAALGEPANGALSQLPVEVGEFLPPVGNNLPVETLPPLLQQDSPTRFGELTAIDGVLGLDESTGQTGTTVDLLSAGLIENTENSVSEEHRDEYGVLSSLESIAPALRQTSDSLAAAQMRDQFQRQIVAKDVLAVNVQGAGGATDRPAVQAIDLTSSVAVADQRMASEAKDILQYSANAATISFKQFAEKFDAMQKRVTAGSAPAPLAAADNVLSAQGAAQTARIAPPPVLGASIDLPVQDDGWAEALNERVTWMAGKSIQRAEIRLNPANMGPIRIDLSISDDAATVTFSAQHAVTREAIEQALPRLREMLNENGIALAHTNVSDSDVQHGGDASENETLPAFTDDAGISEDGEVTLTTSIASRSTSALVDTFV